MSSPRAARPVPELHVVDVDLREHEVRIRAKRLEADRPKLVRELRPRCSHQHPPFVHGRSRAQARAPCGKRDAVHVERLLEEVEVRDERLVDERIAESEPGEAVDLREAPEDDHATPLCDVELAADAALGRDEVGVGLVDDGNTPVRQRVEEVLPLGGSEREASGIVGVADPGDAGIDLAGGLGQRCEIDLEIAHRHAMHHCTARRRDLRVEAVRQLGHDDAVARSQEQAGSEPEQREAAVRREDVRRARAGSGRDLVPEVDVRLLGIEPDVFELARGSRRELPATVRRGSRSSSA